MLLYALLHLTGFPDMTIEELKRFRQLGSRTPGHPEYGHTPGIETTTGPLGQGLANAVGMALAERHAGRPLRRDARRPPHLRHRRRRLPDGGHQPRGRLAGRASAPRPADRPVRRQRHLDRRPDLARLLRRRAGARFARLWLAHGRRRRPRPRGDRGRASRPRAPDRPAVADRLPDRHRQGRAHQGGQARRTHGAPLGDEEIAAAREALGWPHRARSRCPTRSWPPGARPASAARRPSGLAARGSRRSPRPARRAAPQRSPASCRTRWRRAVDGAHKRKLRRAAAHHGHPQVEPGGARGADRGACRSWSAARPTSPTPTTPSQRHTPAVDAGRLRRPLRPLRRARARHGRGHERHGPAWRRHPLWRHLPGVLRLLPPGDPPGGADGHAGRSTS